jgi:hypothetical protein
MPNDKSAGYIPAKTGTKGNTKSGNWTPKTTGGSTLIDAKEPVTGNTHPQQSGSSSK